MSAPVFACTLVFPPAFTLAVALLLRLSPAVFARDWLVCAASATTWSLLPPPWWPAADGSAVSLLTAAAWWWTNRRGGRRARAAGSRGLAVLARLAAGMRGAARGPRPGQTRV